MNRSQVDEHRVGKVTCRTLYVALISLLLLLMSGRPVFAEDWSTALIDSTMAKTPSPTDVGPWEYSRALYLYGAYQTYQRTGNRRYFDYVKAWTDSHVDATGHIDKSLDALDDVLAGNLLLVLWNETHDRRYKVAATTIRHRMDTYPRLKDGTFWHGSHLPDQVWLDGLYMAEPFLMRFGNAFDDQGYASAEATQQFVLSSSHLRDPKTGLYFHAYDDTGTIPQLVPGTRHTAIFWARSIGWYGMALVDVLDNMKSSDPNRSKLLKILNEYVEAVTRFQDQKTGLWYQVVNRPDLSGNWLETSSSSMFVYTLYKAVEHGYIARTYLPAADRGYAGVLTHISRAPNGSVQLVDICEGTNLGDLDFYLARARNTNDPHGLGAFLLMNEAALEFRRTQSVAKVKN
jgi:unsaturated rhamnogalacturonyl hydrolase